MTLEEMNAIMAIAKNGGSKTTDMSSFEQFKMAGESAKRTSGTAIAGLVVGSVALIAGIGSWIYAGNGLNKVERGQNRAIDLLAQQAMAERSERINHQINNNPRIIDYINLSTGGASANASALSQAEAIAAILNGNGRNSQVCPSPVALYQPAMPCACPAPAPCGCTS